MYAGVEGQANLHDRKLFLVSNMPSVVNLATRLTTLSGMTPDKVFPERSMYDREVASLWKRVEAGVRYRVK